jgi:ABC-type glycerol-3-phosphate transport system substrate-binding protein
MGSIFTPLKNSGELLSNITDPYEIDGKIYTMPLRFKLPFIYGASDAVNAANSITELAEYARNNNEIPLLAPCNYRSLAAWLIMTNYDQILNQDNEIDEAALFNFLKDIKIISDAIHASDDARMSGFTTSGGPVFGYWMAGSIKVYKKECQSNIEELGGMKDFALPLKAVQKRQGSLRAINDMFKAYGLVGINSDGNQKELAKEFIQSLFSKEIQSLNLEGAFPVNKAAMEEWIQLDNNDCYLIVDSISANYPDQKSRNNIYECICAADKPMVNDMTMMDMILDEAEKYLRGDITAEQAASNVVASINLYLSE